MNIHNILKRISLPKYILFNKLQKHKESIAIVFMNKTQAGFIVYKETIFDPLLIY